MSEPLQIRIDCRSRDHVLTIFEARVKPKKKPSPSGTFDLFAGDIQTQKGLSLELDVFFDASMDAGHLTLSSSGRQLFWIAPLKRDLCVIMVLPTEEELNIACR